LFDRLTDQSWYGCEDHSCRACLPVNEIREVDGKDWSCSDSSIIGIDGYCALSLPTQKEIMLYLTQQVTPFSINIIEPKDSVL